MYIFYKENVKLAEIRNMKRRILWCIYIGFIVFNLVTLISGTYGLSNIHRLETFKEKLIHHADRLNLKYDKLTDEIVRLSNDHDRIKQAVRPLGYIDKNEKVIKIVNSKKGNPLYFIDRQYESPIFKPKTNKIMLVSVLLTVILFVISLLLGVLRDTFKRK